MESVIREVPDGSKGPRSGFSAKWFFGGLGYQSQKTIRVRGKNVFAGLAAFGGKAKQTIISGKCAVVWPWYPRPPKNLSANTNFGIPLMQAAAQREKVGEKAIERYVISKVGDLYHGELIKSSQIGWFNCMESTLCQF